MTSTESIENSEGLIEALLSEAHETAAKIIQDARIAVQETLEEQRKKGKKNARERVTSIDTNAQTEFEINKLRNIASAEMKAQWVILEKEHALIDKVLYQVKDELRAFVIADNYVQVLESLIVEGGIILGVTDIEVILNERDSNLPLDLDRLAEKIREKTSINSKIIKSAKKIDAIGGTIIQTTDGKIVVNYTFEGMLKIYNDEIRFKIAQRLFT
jgi:vacuolar-type H+-ATPase subunit E/Vma4